MHGHNAVQATVVRDELEHLPDFDDISAAVLHRRRLVELAGLVQVVVVIVAADGRHRVAVCEVTAYADQVGYVEEVAARLENTFADAAATEFIRLVHALVFTAST